MYLNNKTYDLTKWLVLIFMPAFAVLLKELGDLYLWSDIEQYVATINLLTVFLGSIMQLSSLNYYKNSPPEQNNELQDKLTENMEE